MSRFFPNAKRSLDSLLNLVTGLLADAQSIVACDFLVVTARFRTLYVCLLMEVGTRRIVHCNVTRIQWQPGPCSSFAKRFRAIIPTNVSDRSCQATMYI
jgi:hypothetical protein